MLDYEDKDPFAGVIGKEFAFYGVDNECFKLGDQVFEALEDEDDGYRSYLGSVEVVNREGLIFFNTPLATVMVEEVDDAHSDGYQLVDVADGHVWLYFGTDHTDSWYPMFIFRYQPRKNG